MAVPRYFVLSILFLSYAVGGGGMVAMKLALASFAPAHIALARVFFAGIFYLLLLKKWYRIPYQKGDWKYLASIGIFDPGLFFLLQSFAMKYTTASQGGAIAASYPVITAVMARIFLKEKINPLTIFAIFVCTVGVVGNAFFASVGSEALNPVLGNSLVLLAMFFLPVMRFVQENWLVGIRYLVLLPFKLLEECAYFCLWLYGRLFHKKSFCRLYGLWGIWGFLRGFFFIWL